MTALDFDDIWARAREGTAFSNGDEFECWEVNWCDRCRRDAPFRNGISGTGCPLLLCALSGRVPSEWFEQPWEETGPPLDRYHCMEFRPFDGGGGREPRPQPDPPDMDGLFPRPAEQRRMLAGNPLSVNGRPVRTLIPMTTLL